MIQRIMILSFPRPTDRARHAVAIGLLASCALLCAPALAQDMVSQPVVQSTANPADPEELARAASQRQLTEALGFIAADGSNWYALSQAGRAALALGDARAAVGFLARAEALSPRDPVIKAALGAAMVQLEDPQQAMRYFEAAIAAGGLDRAYLGDRGLAFDLLGDQRRAQADYAVAAVSHSSAELTRRHAISLGISGQPDEAIRMLAPLLRAQDRAAWRSRAMIVAMNGRPDEARQIARTTMPPQLAEALDPYFALMDRLTPDQLAAASHFGRFPTYDALRGQPSRANAARVAAANTTAPEPVNSRNRDRFSRSRDRDRNRGNSNRNGRRAPTASPAPTPVRVAVVPRRVEPSVPAANSAPPPSVAPPAAPIVRPPVQQVAAAPMPTSSVPPPAATTVAPGSVPASITVRSTATGPVAGPPDTERQYASAAPSAAVATASPQPDVIYYPDPAALAEPVVQQLATLAPVPQSDPTPAAAPPSVPTTQLAGWSLDSVIGSIEIPDSELAASANALSLAEMDAIVTEQRRAAQAAAEARAAARADARTEARTRAAAEAEARRREEARVAAEAEATRRRSPARFWVQVATGSSTSALAFDCRRLARDYAASFRGQSCATAAWNRTNRLVVGPFRTMAAAREWETAYKRAGGDGFAWASDAGEEVTPVGRGR